jgi:hypothetical protein
LIVELGGMLGALVAIGGLWLCPWKSRWLEARLMIERIRQWHFQLLVRRGQQVEASCQKQEFLAHFERQRELWFDDFLKAYEGNLDGKLKALTDETSQADVWLRDTLTAYSNRSATLERVVAAFKRLRFDHQLGYADYKLRTERKESPIRATVTH